MRTGMGALPDPTVATDPSLPPHEQPGNRCWHLFNYGFGPYNDGIFTQSSLGIVVKMGIWLRIRPYARYYNANTYSADAESGWLSGLHDYFST